MSLVRFKDLCIDARDVDRQTDFWAAALGLRAERLADGDRVLRGSAAVQTVWVNRVPEPVTVKSRVHIDVHARSVEEIEGFGARRLPGWEGLPWTVMGDPDGNELCVFVRDDAWWETRSDPYRLYEVAVDAANPKAIAGWWADVFGVERGDDDDGVSWVEPPGAMFDSFTFAAVPEPKTVKNRVHWDVTGGPDAVDDLVRRGALILRQPDESASWTVMADPEGNEFCMFVEGG